MPAAVYEIINTASQKRYIGSSKNYTRRFSGHKAALKSNTHPNKHLQSAWNKYGENAFTFKLLLICSPELMRFYEQRGIDVLKPEYNQSKSAYSGVPIGTTLPTKVKIKIGKQSKLLWQTNEYRGKVTAAINKAMTQEESVKRSERAKILWANPEYREKAIAARKGKAYLKGYKCTPEQVKNRQKAARISNTKRKYGESWRKEYVRIYPLHAGDIDA